jgi:hypothetical protein
MITDAEGRSFPSAFERSGAVPTALIGGGATGSAARLVRCRLIRHGNTVVTGIEVLKIFLALACAIVMFWFLIVDVTHRGAGFDPLRIFIITVLLLISVLDAWSVWYRSTRRIEDHKVISFLLEMNRCPSCFYDLSHLGSEDSARVRCPECGAMWKQNNPTGPRSVTMISGD